MNGKKILWQWFRYYNVFIFYFLLYYKNISFFSSDGAVSEAGVSGAASWLCRVYISSHGSLHSRKGESEAFDPEKSTHSVLRNVLYLASYESVLVMCSLFVLIQNIKKKMYGSTEACLADVKWILHNCIIYNGGRLLTVQQHCHICFSWMFVLLKRFVSVFLLGNHKLTATAKVIVKICEHEVCTINYKLKYANAFFSAS